MLEYSFPLHKQDDDASRAKEEMGLWTRHKLTYYKFAHDGVTLFFFAGYVPDVKLAKTWEEHTMGETGREVGCSIEGESE
jgi:hypothetical protein